MDDPGLGWRVPTFSREAVLASPLRSRVVSSRRRFLAVSGHRADPCIDITGLHGRRRIGVPVARNELNSETSPVAVERCEQVSAGLEAQHVERPHASGKRRPGREGLDRFAGLVARDQILRIEDDADRVGGEFAAAHPGVGQG